MYTIRNLALSTLCLIFLTACAMHSPECSSAKLGAGERIALIGIRTPDSVAAEATRYSRMLLDEVPFSLERPRTEFPEMDEQGKLFRYVRLPDGRDLGAELLRAGYACVCTEQTHPLREEYLAIENEARRNHVGIWSTLMVPNAVQR